jgi:hypothetical protein
MSNLERQCAASVSTDCPEGARQPVSQRIATRDAVLGEGMTIRPGQLNLMTAGRGIAHSEESPRERPPGLHGAQLWIALPDADRNCEPAFDHYAELPVLQRDGVTITVLLGEEVLLWWNFVART